MSNVVLSIIWASDASTKGYSNYSITSEESSRFEQQVRDGENWITFNVESSKWNSSMSRHQKTHTKDCFRLEEIAGYTISSTESKD